MELSGPSLVGPSVPRLEERSFGRFELLCHLATGGMAHIYVAQLSDDGGRPRLFAIKRIHDDYNEDEHFIQMFIDEALVASRIAHPNVVQVLELGEVDDVHFLAMEYVHGESLRALMRRVRLPLTASAYVMACAAAGLHAAHELRDDDEMPLDVVHRDISPQNILVGYDGTVKVTDFGVARARDQIHVTQSGAIKGKYSYMSPEQTLARDLDRRSDIFSFGIVLYELTTGKRLFRAKTPSETLRAVRQKTVVPPSEIVKQYPPALERIVLKSLQRQRDRRQQTARELQAELERYLDDAGCSAAEAQRELQRLMQKVFEERIAKREKLLSMALEATEVVEADDSPNGAPPSGESGVAVLVGDEASGSDATARYADKRTAVSPTHGYGELQQSGSWAADGSLSPHSGSGQSSRVTLQSLWRWRVSILVIFALLALAAGVAVTASMLSQGGRERAAAAMRREAADLSAPQQSERSSDVPPSSPGRRPAAAPPQPDGQRSSLAASPSSGVRQEVRGPSGATKRRSGSATKRRQPGSAATAAPRNRARDRARQDPTARRGRAARGAEARSAPERRGEAQAAEPAAPTRPVTKPKIDTLDEQSLRIMTLD